MRTPQKTLAVSTALFTGKQSFVTNQAIFAVRIQGRLTSTANTMNLYEFV